MALLLEAEERKATLVGQEGLAELFGGRRSVQLVVLAACRGAWRTGLGMSITGLGPLIVRYGVPAVVAMQDPIPEKTAMFFTQKFYEALARWRDKTGGMVDVAMNEARKSLYFEFLHNDDTDWDWAIPVPFPPGHRPLVPDRRRIRRSRAQ